MIDRARLASLYVQCGAAVERRCRALLGDGEEARDMVQEVFLRAATHAAEFRGDASPFTWIYRITTNLCLNRLRDRKATLPLDEAAPGLFAFGSTPEGVALARQSARLLFKNVDPRTQEAVVYTYLDGMSQDEIAPLVGWSRKTLGKKLAQFHERARKLEEHS